MRAAMEPGLHPMSDELILQISCNIFLAFNWILMMRSGQNIWHHTTAKLSVLVWNHDLIWRQNKIDTQKHVRKTTITSSWTLSKTKIPITIVKAQIPSNPNQKSRTWDNDTQVRNATVASHTDIIVERVHLSRRGFDQLRADASVWEWAPIVRTTKSKFYNPVGKFEEKLAYTIFSLVHYLPNINQPYANG